MAVGAFSFPTSFWTTRNRGQRELRPSGPETPERARTGAAQAAVLGDRGRGEGARGLRTARCLVVLRRRTRRGETRGPGGRVNVRRFPAL